MRRSASSIQRNSCDGNKIQLLLSRLAQRLAVRAMQPPGYIREWHVAVRVASNKKLVAFVSAVPISLRVREK